MRKAKPLRPRNWANGPVPRSLSHAAYMAYARRAPQSTQVLNGERPKGELVWAHAADKDRAEALCQIAERLSQLRPGLHMLLTTSDSKKLPSRAKSCVLTHDLPDENIALIQAFLEHWSPDLCLWTGGDLRPALLTCADELHMPLFLIDADETQLDRPGWRWFPDLPRSILRCFAQIQVRSAEAAQNLRRAGVQDLDINITGPLRTESVPLPCNETEREEIAQTLLGRPVWLAAHLQPEELGVILEARQKASRLSHRLILVISPEDPKNSDAFAETLRKRDLRVARWVDGDMPEETTQVILADDHKELGLWYRLAPVCFLGSSLESGMKGHDPNEPAVHGSAILHGPYVPDFSKEYARYSAARAARMVRDAETLSTAIGQVIAPDKAAAMAHAAWDIASQGAEVTDRILDLVQDTLDIVGDG